MKQILIFALLVAVGLSPHAYFLYCLEKRRKWALEMARMLEHCSFLSF
jgi:hypothetical protein